jgi:hypothetical protein
VTGAVAGVLHVAGQPSFAGQVPIARVIIVRLFAM